MIELEKKVVEFNLDKIRIEEKEQNLIRKNQELREKFNSMVKEKGDI